MDAVESKELEKEHKAITSAFLAREVKIDFYLPEGLLSSEKHLLLINDGQDLVTMNFGGMYHALTSAGKLKAVVCIGIHCGPDRRQEYGTHTTTDYAGRGNKAGLYNQFLFKELMPFIYNELGICFFFHCFEN